MLPRGDRPPFDILKFSLALEKTNKEVEMFIDFFCCVR